MTRKENSNSPLRWLSRTSESWMQLCCSSRQRRQCFLGHFCRYPRRSSVSLVNLAKWRLSTSRACSSTSQAMPQISTWLAGARSTRPTSCSLQALKPMLLCRKRQLRWCRSHRFPMSSVSSTTSRLTLPRPRKTKLWRNQSITSLRSFWSQKLLMRCLKMAGQRLKRCPKLWVRSRHASQHISALRIKRERHRRKTNLTTNWLCLTTRASLNKKKNHPTWIARIRLLRLRRKLTGKIWGRWERGMQRAIRWSESKTGRRTMFLKCHQLALHSQEPAPYTQYRIGRYLRPQRKAH